MRRFRRRDILATTTALALGLKTGAIHAQGTPMHPHLILVNGRFTTLDRANPNPEAVAIAGGRFRAVGNRRCSGAAGDVCLLHRDWSVFWSVFESANDAVDGSPPGI